MRLFEFGTVYRFERSGVLNGLLRVRGITQDDSHIFCARDQLAAELADLLGFVLRILRTFGLTEFEAELATRPEKFVGEPAEWDEATEALRQALESAGIPLRRGRGRGGLLRPQDRRARPRRHRPALAGVDPAGRLPAAAALRPRVRGRRQPAAPALHDPPGPVRLDRAVLRHPARALRRRLPDLAGAGPGPHPAGARRPSGLRRRASPTGSAADGFRVDVVAADESLGARIRKAKLEKLPYILVVGDDDVAAGTVGVNRREASGPVRGVPVADFVDQLAGRGRTRTPASAPPPDGRSSSCGPAGAASTSTGRGRPGARWRVRLRRHPRRAGCPTSETHIAVAPPERARSSPSSTPTPTRAATSWSCRPGTSASSRR